jgi:hypothetical protein
MTLNKRLVWLSAVALIALAIGLLPQRAAAQDQDDPPGRVARLGYMEGSVSMQPAGESDWVQAVANRPMTTGDKLWADRDSRAEVQLGSAAIRLGPNTGFSFLNLDDDTIQIQLTSGVLNISVRRLERDNVFEVDTPNQAFSVYQPGSYRVEASEDGTYTVVTVREGEGESTGNGQTYKVHAGQRATFSGTDTLNADVVQIGQPDQFDNWAYNRERRYHDSRSAHYLSPSVVGYDDLDDYGDWRDDPGYGHVWFPTRVSAGWAPYHYGHWDWIDPWGWTWVDDSPWGYAPFHYGRWAFIGGRWGWCPGPVAVRAVYAPALVVFVGSFGGGFAGNVGWFPLGPREVFVPSYRVSQAYVTRVNVSNTTVNTTTITNVYNTTIVNKSTNITNVTYANRNVQGAMTAVPQRTFASAQPVAKAAVRVDARDIASAPVTARVAVAPTRESVLGAKAATANHVTAPPQAVMNRQVIAKATPPPPPVPFAKQQQALAAHPGQPLARQEVKSLRPAAAAQAHPQVKQAPPGKPATPNTGRPGNQPSQPGNQPGAARPGQPANAPPENQPSARPAQPGNPPSENQPANRPGNPPASNERPGANNQPNRPPSAQPNRPEPAQPGNRPEQQNRPAEPPARSDRPPSAQPNRPEPAQPGNRAEQNRPAERPAQNERAPSAQPNRPEPAQPSNRPEANRPEQNRPAEQPTRNERQAQPNRPEPAQPGNRPEANRPNRPEQNRPAEQPPARNERPAAQPNRPEPSRNQAEPERKPSQRQEAKPAPSERKKPETPEEKKKREKEQEKQEKPPSQ